MSYTNVPKPTGSNYTRVNFPGRFTWDDPGVFWDDPDVFWDGSGSPDSGYTNVLKPLGGGLLWQNANFEWQEALFIWGDNFGAYTKVSKPIV